MAQIETRRSIARRTRAGAVRPAAVALLLAAVSLTGLIVVVPGLPTAPRPSGDAPTPASVESSAAAAFASRAGYAPALAQQVVGARSSTGAVPVELTFHTSLTPSAYASVVAYFESRGLRVSSLDPHRLALGVTGPASLVGAVFGTTLRSGTYDGRSVQYPSSSPSLPAPLEAEVAGVVGLSNGFTTFSFSLLPKTVPAASGDVVDPALARRIYQLSGLYNLTGGAATYPNGTAIAVLLWGEGYAPSDLATFFSEDYPTSTFPAPHIYAYPVAGAPAPSAAALSSPDIRAVEELTLDIEWSESMAPGATIDAVYAPDGPSTDNYSPSTANLTAALVKALSLNVSVISMSFGAPESGAGSLASAWKPLLAEAASRNITVLAATGDTGGDATLNNTACSGGPAPEYPASSPQVVAVGGTNVTYTRSGGGVTFSESGWMGSGGGYSTLFGAPSWQEQGSAAAPIKASGHRGMPDVSATAALNFVYFDSKDQVAAGTSFAAPLWAGLVASIDAKAGRALGFFTPNLYHVGAQEASGGIGKGLADVTTGGNCLGAATVGWDTVTGWGTPRAPILYNDLLGSFVTISLTVARTSVSPGGSLPVQVVVTGRTNGTPLADVPVTLTIRSDTQLGPCVGNFTTSTPETNALGAAAATLSVPFCYLGPHADVNASVATVQLYGSSGEKVSVNLLGDFPSLQFLSRPPWAYVTYAVIVGAAAVGGAWIGRPRDGLPPVRAKRRPASGSSPPPTAKPTDVSSPGPGSPAASSPSTPVSPPPAAPAAPPSAPAPPPSESPPPTPAAPPTDPVGSEPTAPPTTGPSPAPPPPSNA